MNGEVKAAVGRPRNKEIEKALKDFNFNPNVF